MSMIVWECAFACGLLVPAQSAPVLEQPPASTVLVVPIQFTQTGTNTGARPAVDEEIAVMRTLLTRKLAAAIGRNTPTNYPLSRNVGPYMDLTNNLSTWYTTSRVADVGPIAVEGVHLDGYGVVFTVTMPASASRNPLEGKAPPTPAPLSEWEQALRRLHGELQPPAAAPKEASPGDVLLHLLADNGKHFVHLRDDERLTVVVTFHNQPTGRPPTSVASLDPTRATETTAAVRDIREDRVATMEGLGDMHLKQGDSQKAVEAYIKAASLAENELNDAIKAPPDYSNYRSRYAQALTKLAQAYVAAGKMDEARDAMERAKGPQRNEPTKAAASAAGPRLPAKLTVSATKRQLDLVGSGKMTLEEFRKEAKVEFYPATGAAKPAAGEKK